MLPTNDPLTAVVIGLDSPTGLQASRELTDLGVPTCGVADDRTHPCARTRSCRRVLEADTGSDELLTALERLAEEGGGSRRLLVPCTDRSVLMLSRHRDEVGPADVLLLPEPELVERLLDKARFVEFARDEGLPVAPSRTLSSRRDAEVAASELAFPCAVKPHRKTAAWRSRTDAKLFRADRPEELLLLYDRCAQWARPLVAQSWIPGPDTDHYTCNAYVGPGGEHLAVHTSRKLRQWPETGGQGCLAESCVDEEVRRIASRVFGRPGYRGLAYLETKRDPRTGEHRILEVNVGRPTGRSALARAAGTPLLETMCRDAAGLDLRPAPTRGRDGVRWVHLRRDTQAAVSRMLRGELGPTEWFRSVRGPRIHALFSWRDPVPFWLDLVRATLKAARLVGRKLRPGPDQATSGTDARVAAPPPERVGDDLAALRRGYLPLHASAFVHEGRGAIVAGPAHSGKTGALLAFAARGARFVADDRVLLRRDGRRMEGERPPLTVRLWHLRQLPELWRHAPPGRQLLVGVLETVEGVAGRPGPSAADPGPEGSVRWLRRAGSALRRRLSVEMSPEELFGPDRCLGDAVPATLFLLENRRDGGIEVEPTTPELAADRLLALAQVEWRASPEAPEAAGGGRPELGTAPPGELTERMREGLAEALAGMESYVVRLPHPCSLHDLYTELQGALGDTATGSAA